IFAAAQRQALVRRGEESNGDKTEGGAQTGAKNRQQKENPGAEGRQKTTITRRHRPFRDAALGTARLSSAALASNPLRAVFLGMRGIRHHTGSVWIVDHAFAQPQSRPKLIGPRTRNRSHQCCRRPQSPRETRARGASPQPERRADGPCTIDSRWRATDPENVSADATGPEASAQPASPAGA